MSIINNWYKKYKTGAEDRGEPLEETKTMEGGVDEHSTMPKETFILISNLLEKIKPKSEELWGLNQEMKDFTRDNLTGLTPDYLKRSLMQLNQLLVNFKYLNADLQDWIQEELTTNIRTSKKIAVDYSQEEWLGPEWSDPQPNPHNIPPEELSNIPEEPDVDWSAGRYPEFKLNEQRDILNKWLDYLSEILHWTDEIRKDILETQELNKLADHSNRLHKIITELIKIIEISGKLRNDIEYEVESF